MAEVQLLRLVDDLRADLRGDMDMVGDEAHVGMCSMCRKSVRRDDEMCMLRDRYCHVACFNCKGCGKNLRSIGYYEDGDDMFCENCHLDRKALKCSTCGKHITKSILHYKDKPFHSECFTCESCQTPLDGKAFFDLGATRKCEACHTADVTQAAPKCGACGKAIVANTCAKIGETRFHNECVLCTVCRKALDDGIRMKNAKLYCAEHHASA